MPQEKVSDLVSLRQYLCFHKSALDIGSDSLDVCLNPTAPGSVPTVVQGRASEHPRVAPSTFYERLKYEQGALVRPCAVGQ